MEYYIYMTNNCNMMCAYCSVEFDCKKNHIPFLISYPKEDLLNFIQKTQSAHPDKDVTIFFFGGEPTLEYKKIAELIPYLKKGLADFQVSFVIHTNGLLLEKIPSEILKELRLITLSVNYEKLPSYNLKNSYFETVMNAVEHVRNNSNCPIVGRLTISQKTCLYREMRLFAHLFDTVYWQLENCACFAKPAEYAETVKYETALLFKDWLNKLRAGVMLPWIPFMSVVKFMFYPDRSDEDFCCGYDGHQVYIQTEGTCFACCDSVPQGAHTIGSLKNGIVFNSKKVTDYGYCRDCSYRRLCMGRCGRMHVDFSKEHIEEYCKINQAMFDLFIQNKDELAEILKQNPQFQNQLTGWALDITEYIP